jgi:hypothetical protein
MHYRSLRHGGQTQPSRQRLSTNAAETVYQLERCGDRHDNPESSANEHSREEHSRAQPTSRALAKSNAATYYSPAP